MIEEITFYLLEFQKHNRIIQDRIDHYFQKFFKLILLIEFLSTSAYLPKLMISFLPLLPSAFMV